MILDEKTETVTNPGSHSSEEMALGAGGISRRDLFTLFEGYSGSLKSTKPPKLSTWEWSVATFNKIFVVPGHIWHMWYHPKHNPTYVVLPSKFRRSGNSGSYLEKENWCNMAGWQKFFLVKIGGAAGRQRRLNVGCVSLRDPYGNCRHVTFGQSPSVSLCSWTLITYQLSSSFSTSSCRFHPFLQNSRSY